MSTQLLTPFKAKFVLTTRTSVFNFFKEFDEISIEEKYNAVRDCSENVDMIKFIKHHHLSFTDYHKYENLGLNYHKAFEVHPENVLADNKKDYDFVFKVESAIVEVLQIVDGTKITFANFKNEVYTIEQNDNLVLNKLLDYTNLPEQI